MKDPLRRASRDPRVAGVLVSNPTKVWWPDDGITKLDMARFYDGLWTKLRPWLRDRPLTAENFKEFEKCYGSEPNGLAKRRDLGEEGRFARRHPW